MHPNACHPAKCRYIAGRRPRAPPRRWGDRFGNRWAGSRRSRWHSISRAGSSRPTRSRQRRPRCCGRRLGCGRRRSREPRRAVARARPVSTLVALARAQAYAAGRAQPIATVRHLHVHDRPLVLIPLAMAGEANAPLAAMVGTEAATPRLLVVEQPRNRDERFAFAAELAGHLVPYLESFAGETEAVAVDRGRDVRHRFVDAPQVWGPNTGGVDFLRLFGRSTRFRRVDGDHPVPASVPLLGRWLTFLAGSSEVPGSALLPTAVQALTLHWATGQSGAEDNHLGALLAWLESG